MHLLGLLPQQRDQERCSQHKKLLDSITVRDLGGLHEVVGLALGSQLVPSSSPEAQLVIQASLSVAMVAKKKDSTSQGALKIQKLDINGVTSPIRTEMERLTYERRHT